MEIAAYQIVLAITVVSTFVTGAWLMVHAPGIARLFRSYGLVRSRKSKPASKASVRAAFFLFNASWLVAVFTLVMAAGYRS